MTSLYALTSGVLWQIAAGDSPKTRPICPSATCASEPNCKQIQRRTSHLSIPNSHILAVAQGVAVPTAAYPASPTCKFHRCIMAQRPEDSSANSAVAVQHVAASMSPQSATHSTAGGPSGTPNRSMIACLSCRRQKVGPFCTFESVQNPPLIAVLHHRSNAIHRQRHLPIHVAAAHVWI